MPYFPVDDDMPFHPKVLAAGNEAIGFWTRAGALCKKYATGGEVSHEMAATLGPKKLADRLVQAGLWVEIDGGYRFHDWKQQAGNDDADVEKERLERSRERNAERQRAWRERNKGSNGDRNGVTNAPVTTTPSPSPNRLTLTNESSHVAEEPHETDSDLSTIGATLAAQAGILDVEFIRARILERLDRDLTPDRAVTVARWLIGKAKDPAGLRSPQKYVVRCINLSPAEVQKYIDDSGLAA